MVHISRGHSDPAVVRDEKGRGVSEQLRVYGADRSRYVPAIFKILTSSPKRRQSG